MNTVIQGMADHQRQLYEKKDVDEASDVSFLKESSFVTTCFRYLGFTTGARKVVKTLWTMFTLNCFLRSQPNLTKLSNQSLSQNPWKSSDTTSRL